MKKPDLSVNIPFAGFYDSIWSGELDSIEEREIENFCDEMQKEESVPRALRLDRDEYADILYRRANYGAMHESAARATADAYNHVVSEELGFPLGMTFEEMTSPKYYNFETDRIFMSIPRDSVAKLFRLAKSDKFRKLSETINERHTSGSGFISFYTNDLAEWLAKPARFVRWGVIAS